MHFEGIFPRKPKKSYVSPVNLGRVGLPLTHVIFLFDLKSVFRNLSFQCPWVLKRAPHREFKMVLLSTTISGFSALL